MSRVIDLIEVRTKLRGGTVTICIVARDLLLLARREATE